MSGGSEPKPAAGAPPLRPFGLVLHADGSWTHEGIPIRHARLRAAFDRGVRFLPEQRVYVVQLGRFRGQIDVEEAAFFVREVDVAAGVVRLSDGSRELLDPASLRVSPRGGALLCSVKRELALGGLPARFTHAAQAELLAEVVETPEGPALRLAGKAHALPGLEVAPASD